MKKTATTAVVLVLLVSMIGFTSPAKTDQMQFQPKQYVTQNVIMINTDGLRYEDGFAKKSENMPHLWNDLRPMGTIFTSIWNNGTTYTAPGHTVCITGSWQYQPNNGRIRPDTPTMFEYYRKQFGAKPEDTLILPGKGNCWHLSYSAFPGFGRPYETPFYDLGANDDEIVAALKERMATQKPKMIYAILPHVDSAGHMGDYKTYCDTIKNADSLIWDVWNTVQSDPFYKDKTTLVVTTDHGRHTTGVKDGFVSHGDTCEGCRHVYALMVGPDIKKGYEYKTECYQTDLAPTIGQLMGFATPAADGKPLMDALVDRPAKTLSNDMEGYIIGLEKECAKLKQQKYGDNLKKMLDFSLTVPVDKLAFKLRDAVFMQGVFEASTKLNRNDGVAYVQKWADAYIAKNPKLTNIADIACGTVFCRLADKLADEKYRQQAKKMADWAMTFPLGKSKEGAIEDTVFLGKSNYAKMVVAQNLYAILPLCAELSKKYGDSYTKFSTEQYTLHKKLLADSNGLLRHYLNPAAKADSETNPVDWARGTAYGILGLMDSFATLPTTQKTWAALGNDKMIIESLHHQQQNGTWLDDLSGECSDIDTVSNGLMIAGYCAWFNKRTDKGEGKPITPNSNIDIDAIASDDPPKQQPKAGNFLGGALCSVIGAWESWYYMISDTGMVYGSSIPAPNIQRGYDSFMPPVYGTDRGFNVEGQGAMMMALSRLSTLCESTGQMFYRKPQIH